ncbi:MAG TPA: dephospho-CoA kinase [Candidatus Limnocylindria bacterium]|nr:dephospho-CoA kinase [Candidatus Limnocylindria bacterium]
MAALSIGLTGGIGSGKSTVAAMLAELGALVIDADRVGHEIYLPGTEGFRRVRDAFGPGVVAPDGTIDRKALGARVFADPAELARLNALLHPLIGAAIRERLAAARAARPDVPVVVEAAIMLEAGWRFFDQLWVVVVSPEVAVARVMASRGLERAEVERRIAAQLSNEERRRQADVVIENDGSLDELRAQVKAAWRALPR